MSSFTANDVKIPVQAGYFNKEVTLWFVRGQTDYCYPTKMAAETAARQFHPGKDTNSMVFYMVSYFGEEDSYSLDEEE